MKVLKKLANSLVRQVKKEVKEFLSDYLVRS